MTDFVANVFRFSNGRGYFVPGVNVEYEEQDTGQLWQINCAGTRGYLLRFGVGAPIVDDLDAQSADSHFMVQRVTSALLISGAGLFDAEAVGRLIFKNVEGQIEWSSHLDVPDPFQPAKYEALRKTVGDWLSSIVPTHVVEAGDSRCMARA